MIYETNLSTKGINAIVRDLKKRRAKYETMVKEFFFDCCRKIIEYANANIRNYPIGDKVLFDIMTNWHYAESFTGNSIVLSNRAEKAAYVEFGVGIVAESSPHPLANDVNYDYNKPSFAKSTAIAQGKPDGTWVFYQNQDDLDLPTSALDDRIYFNEPNTRRSNRMLIQTRGTEPTMFLFNAVLMFINNNDAVKIWEEVKQRYWG